METHATGFLYYNVTVERPKRDLHKTVDIPLEAI